MSAGVARSVMNSHALTMSSTLTMNDPSPHSPSDPPRPSASKRSMPMPSAASCLQIRAAAGESLPSVKPCEKTPQPRTAPSGTSMIPARSGPVELLNVTRSPMVDELRRPLGAWTQIHDGIVDEGVGLSRRERLGAVVHGGVLQCQGLQLARGSAPGYLLADLPARLHQRRVAAFVVTDTHGVHVGEIGGLVGVRRAGVRDAGDQKGATDQCCADKPAREPLCCHNSFSNARLSPGLLTAHIYQSLKSPGAQHQIHGRRDCVQAATGMRTPLTGLCDVNLMNTRATKGAANSI